MKIFSLLLLLIVAFVIFVGVEKNEGQSVNKNSEKRQKKPNYKVARMESKIIDGDKVLLLNLSINSKYLNREDMIELARQVKNDFQKEEKIDALFFINYNAAKTFDEEFHPHSKNYEKNWKAIKGRYFLNRKTEEEYVSFSTIEKKPFDGEKIDLSKKKN
jgi:hypothetical protein